MAFNKFSSWLLTDFGKKCAFYAAGTTTTAFMLGTVLPHTIFLEQYKEIFHLYKNGFTVQLTDKLKERFERTLELVGVDKSDRHLYKPFAVFGFDVFSAGSAHSTFGTIIGLPANFTYEDVEHIDRARIKLRGDSIPWDLDEAKALLKSYIISEKGQMYAMAREIKYRQTAKPLIDTVITVLSCTGCYGLCNSINMKLNLYAKPLITRIIMYSLVGAFTFGSYALAKDVSQVYYERKIDLELKSTNKIFAEGGKEYYTKLLERNKAFRALLGKEGERTYSVFGNEMHWIRNKHIPLVQRRELFEDEKANEKVEEKVQEQQVA